jgi:hypothetical protein
MKLTYQKAKKAIEEAFLAGDITQEEKEEKLKLAEKLKTEKPKKVVQKTKSASKRPEPKTEKATLPKNEKPEKIENCKKAISEFNAKKRAEKAELARKKMSRSFITSRMRSNSL